MNSRKIFINRQLTFKLWLTRFGTKDLKMSAQTTPIEVINWGMTTPSPIMVSSQTDHLILHSGKFPNIVALGLGPRHNLIPGFSEVS